MSIADQNNLEIVHRPGICREIKYVDRTTGEHVRIGELYGGGNPHYTLSLEPDSLLPLLSMGPDDVVLIDGTQLTYSTFRENVLPHVAHVFVPPQRSKPTFPHIAHSYMSQEPAPQAKPQEQPSIPQHLLEKEKAEARYAMDMLKRITRPRT